MCVYVCRCLCVRALSGEVLQALDSRVQRPAHCVSLVRFFLLALLSFCHPRSYFHPSLFLFLNLFSSPLLALNPPVQRPAHLRFSGCAACFYYERSFFLIDAPILTTLLGVHRRLDVVLFC